MVDGLDGVEEDLVGPGHLHRGLLQPPVGHRRRQLTGGHQDPLGVITITRASHFPYMVIMANPATIMFWLNVVTNENLFMQSVFTLFFFKYLIIYKFMLSLSTHINLYVHQLYLDFFSLNIYQHIQLFV